MSGLTAQVHYILLSSVVTLIVTPLLKCSAEQFQASPLWFLSGYLNRVILSADIASCVHPDSQDKS